MKRISIPALTIFALLLLATFLPARFEGKASPPSCSGNCVITKNACNAACNGNAECMATCQSEYECCILACHNSPCKSKTVKPQPRQ